jgi:hypothetical protein
MKYADKKVLRYRKKSKEESSFYRQRVRDAFPRDQTPVLQRWKGTGVHELWRGMLGYTAQERTVRMNS